MPVAYWELMIPKVWFLIVILWVALREIVILVDLLAEMLSAKPFLAIGMWKPVDKQFLLEEIAELLLK